MPRKRFLSPDIWADAFFVRLTHTERLLFIGLITLADDEGRVRAEASYLRGQIFPRDGLTDDEITAMRNRIAQCSRNIRLYRNKGNTYLAFMKWYNYQRPSNPVASRLPTPPNARPGLRSTLTEVQRKCVLTRDKLTCQYCGFCSHDARRIFVDHVVPLSRGGDNSEQNLVACCWRCSTKKRDQLPDEAGLTVPSVARLYVEAFKGKP